MKALVELIARVDAGYPARARGVDADALEALEVAWGRPLLGAYRAFFAEVAGDLPLFANGDLEFDPRQLIGYIVDADTLVQGERPPPDRFLPLAILEDDALFLDLAHRSGDDDARVVRVVDACYDDAQPLAASLRDWLLDAAFAKLAASQFKRWSSMAWLADDLGRGDGLAAATAAAAEVTRALGLEPIAGTSPALALHLAPDLAVTIDTRAGGLTVTLRATERLRLTRALRAFTAALPTRPRP